MTQKTQKEPLLPAYLSCGDDALRRRKVADRLIARFAEYGDTAFNVDTFDGSVADGGEIVSACNSLPFLSEKRLVMVKQIDKAPKATMDMLVEYLGDPCDTTVLLIDGAKLASNTRLYKAIAKVGEKAIIACDVPKERDLPNFVRNLACAYGITLHPSAAGRLADIIGPDTIRLDSELKKLSLLRTTKEPITEGEVLSSVKGTVDVKPWVLTDAFCLKDTKRCLELFQQFDTEGYFLLIKMFSDKIRDLITASALMADGRRGEIPNALGKSDWQLKTVYEGVKKYSSEQLISALGGLCDVDYLLKSGSPSSDAFIRWIITVTA